jgi:catechol 2,3-dioxygenase-like lactoylglutathione lyase family enzyme
MRVRRIDHVVLAAREPTRLVAFYRDLFGLEVERELKGLVQLRAGECLIDIVPGRTGTGENLQHFCLTLADWDEAAVRHELGLRGIDASRTAEVYGAEGFGPSIYITDPEGNQVELKGPAVRGLEGRAP